MGRRAAGWGAAAAWCVAASASAQPSPTRDLEGGRAAFAEGVRLYDRGAYLEAVASFERAWTLSERPSVLFNLAMALQRVGRPVDAVLRLETLLAHPESSPAQRDAATRSLAEARRLVSTLTVSSTAPGALLEIDGRRVAWDQPRVLVPGDHILEARRLEGPPTRLGLTLQAGEQRTVQLVMEPTGPVDPNAARNPGTTPVLPSTLLRGTPPTGPTPALRWSVTAAAGLGAIAWLATGLGAAATHRDYRALSAGDPALDATAQQGQTLSVAADVCGIVTLGLTGVAVWLWTRPRTPGQPVSVSAP